LTDSIALQNMSELQIKTERLIIALPQAEDALQALPFFMSNREHFAPWRPPEPEQFLTQAYWDAQIPLAHANFEAGTQIRFWIWASDDPSQMIGTIGFSQIFRGPFSSCMLGYQIGHAYEGKGMMREALQAAIRYIFTEQRLHRIAAGYRPENVRSGRLLSRLGFAIDGFSKEYLFIDGAWRDHILTSLVNDKFQPDWIRAAKP
jgi:[ribosomal protein S5]-alanine N-acetyltransferase